MFLCFYGNFCEPGVHSYQFHCVQSTSSPILKSLVPVVHLVGGYLSLCCVSKTLNNHSLRGLLYTSDINKNQVFTNMYLKILFISTITICSLDTFTTAKPKIKQVFDLIATSSHHKLVKRVSNGYKDAFKSTGFAAIQPTVNN